MSSRGGRTKPTSGRSNSAGSDEETSKSSPSVPAPAAVPASAPAAVAPLDPTAGRKASTELVAQQQLALLASQFLTTSRNFTDVDIDISQDADMLALAKSRFDSGLALIGLLEPHVASSRECKAKYGDLEVACFKIASKCGAQPWAQRYVSNYRSGAPASQSSAMDVTSPIMTLASAAAASAMPMNTSTASARPLTAPTAFPMLNNPYPVLPPHLANHPHLTASAMTNSALAAMGINGLPQPVPVSERYVVLGRNQKPREKKPEEVSIPGKGRKKINPSDMRGKSSNVLSSAMYSIQTHAKNGGKITILLSEAYRRRNEERRNKRKRKFGEVDAAVSKLQRNTQHGEDDDDDSEDDEARAAFYAQNASGGQVNAQGNRLPVASAQELQQLEAEMMQAFDTTLTNIRRFREARGDFQVPDEKSNYFAAFSAPDGRFYGEQGNVQKGEYELMMQLFEALHGKPIEQHCRFSAAKTKYNTFKCPYESLGVAVDEYGATQATQGGEDDEEDMYHHHQQMLAEGNNTANNNPTFNI